MATGNSLRQDTVGSTLGTIGERIGVDISRRLLRLVEIGTPIQDLEEADLSPVATQELAINIKERVIIEGIQFPISEYDQAAIAIDRLVKFFCREDGESNGGFFSDKNIDYKMSIREYILGIKDFVQGQEIETISGILGLFNHSKIGRVQIRKQAEYLKKFSAGGAETIPLFVSTLFEPFGLEKNIIDTRHGFSESKRVKAWDPLMSLRNPLYLGNRVEISRPEIGGEKQYLTHLQLAELDTKGFDISSPEEPSDE